jgi:hypothetical protein
MNATKKTIVHLTTDHSQSCYGIPVLVDQDGNAYGPGDTLPDGRSARLAAAASVRNSFRAAAMLDRFVSR